MRDDSIRSADLIRAQAGATPVGGTPESFGSFMKAEYEKWGRVVKERNIKESP